MVVLPNDAAPLVAAGQLDEQLFHVSDLVREGFDDARAATLPVIVTYAGAPLRSLAAPGIRSSRWLASVGGEAIDADKRDAAALWDRSPMTITPWRRAP